MKTTATEKRLEAIETQLSPKEWVILLLAQQRQYLTAMDGLRAMAKETQQECLVLRAFDALEQQAEERYPGNEPEDIRLRSQLCEALHKEYHTLKLVTKQVGLAMVYQIEPLSLRVALKFYQLQALILQDAFIRSVGGDSPFRKHLAEHLAWMIEDWMQDVVALAKTVFAIPTAVQIIQNRHFDGHSVLLGEWESKLTDMLKILETGIAAFNRYVQSAEHGAEWSRTAQCAENCMVAVTALKADAEAGAALAEKWLRDAKDEAEDDFLKKAFGEWYSHKNRIRKFLGEDS